MADSQNTQEFNRVVSGGSFTITDAPTQDNTNQTQGNTNANATQEQGNNEANKGNITTSTNDGNQLANGSGQSGNTNAESKDGSSTNAEQGNTNIQSTQSNGAAAKGSQADSTNTNADNAAQGNTTKNNSQNQTNTNQTQTNQTVTQNNTMQEKLDKDMQQVDIQLQQEANVKKQEAALNNNTQAPQQLTQADKDRINATLKEAEQALANNAQFIIKVDLSLRAILELILNMRILNDYYVYHADLLKDNKEGIANALIDIETANKRFKLMVEMANNYIQEAIKQMDNANDTSLELRKELEILHDAVQKDLLQTQQDLDIVKTTFEKLQKLEATMGNLDKALNEAELIVAKHAKILQDMKDFINVEMTKAQAELMLKKEEYERDLQATRDLFIEKFNELNRELETKGNTLKTDADTIRFDTINEINTIANNRLAELKKIDIELGANIQATKDNAIADIQSKYSESLDKLKEQTNNLSNDISTLKTQALQELETKRADSINEITNAKDSTLQEMQTLKDSHLQDAEAKRVEIENLSQDSINDIDSKMQEFNTNANNANTNIDSKMQDTLTIIQNKGDDISNILNAKINTIDTKGNEALTNIESKRTEALQNIQTKEQDSITNIDTNEQEAINEIEKQRELNNKQAESNANELENKQNQFLREVSEVQTDYLTEIQGSNFASLKDFIVNLLNPPSVYEKELIQVSFSSNTTWTPPTGLKNIYVTLRGGTGATNADKNGEFSSFGSFITAQGGAGNINGAGQFGESKFMFIQLKDNKTINVTVGSGGYVNLAYNNLEIFDIKLYDTSFIKQIDIPYLPKGNTTITKEEYVKLISDTAELSKLKNIIEIQIDTKDFSDDDITKLSTKGLNIKDRRSLELYITRQLVESKIVTEATKRHLQYILANYKNATTTTQNPATQTQSNQNATQGQNP